MENRVKEGFNVDLILNKAMKAASVFKQFDQEHIDRIVKAVYKAGFNKRIPLAKLACEETKFGIWQDKVIKNVFATRFVYRDIKDLKTVGVISEDEEKGIAEIAQPIGPIFAIIPITNPTSTVLFKILICLKTRNPIIIRPHSDATKCSIEAARICYEAALAEGAPENCVQWVKHLTEEETMALMKHQHTAMILATGSAALVKAAFNSGNPAIGIGSSNVPVFIGETADVPFAVEQIFMSKTFDNGTIYTSEQALVVRKNHVDEVIREFKKRKAYFLSKDEIELLEAAVFNKVNKTMKRDVIGQPAPVIAAMAGIQVPPDTTILIAPLDEVGLQSPLYLEILAPILAFYVAEDIEKAIELYGQINQSGGPGQTISIFSNREEKVRYFAMVVNAGRVLVNTPASQGSMGGIYNCLQPSLTMGGSTGGKNINIENISARHLLNIQRIIKRKVHECVKPSNMNLCLNEAVDADMFEKLCMENK